MATIDEKAAHKKAVEALTDKLHKRLAEKKARKAKKRVEYTPPNYDEEYFRGLEWLDSLAGKPMESN